MGGIDLSGRTIVVTGATGDLGRTMARTAVGYGANVAVHFLKNSEKAEELVTEFRAKGVKAIACQADITVEADVNRMAETVHAELGNVWGIVNNAVIQYEWKHVLAQDLADFESQFRSCTMHNVLMAKAFLPKMIDGAAGGRVVAISTECATECFAGMAAYSGGKRGMDGVLRCLMREVGKHGITVNQVAPGWTIGDRWRSEEHEPPTGYINQVPLGRRGTDQEIANVVAFLLSDLASFVHGAWIPVDGGKAIPAI
jgi:3-oxoacyl-[acyl-carrier protein] reductase